LWQGAAADAFSETANALYRSLGIAGNMYVTLKGALQDWHDKLEQFQLQAIQIDRTVEAWQDWLKTLGDTATDQQVKAAKDEIARAKTMAHELAHQHKEAAAGVAACLRG
jgi:outer membrane murein-binding lipoprotein Lpp